MATLGSLLVALVFVLPQYWYSRHLDRTLAKRWKRLPSWSFYGFVSPASRKAALFEWAWFSTGLAAIFVGFAIWNDFEPRVRTDREMIIASAIAIGTWSALYPVRIYLIRRWIRTGKPRVKGMKHPSKNRD